MARNKRKRESNKIAENDHTYQTLHGPSMELTYPETTELNNNSRSMIEDMSLPSRIENDSILEIMKPKKHRSNSAQTELGSQTNKNPESYSQEINSISLTPVLKKKRTRKSRDTKQKTLDKSEPMVMNNNPTCDNGDENSVTRIQIQTISKTSKPRAKYARKPRCKTTKKLIESEVIMQNMTSADESRNILSDTWLEIDSTAETVEQTKNFGSMSALEDTLQKELIESEPIDCAMSSNSQCESNDKPLATHQQIDSILVRPNHNKTYTREFKSKTSKTLIKSMAMVIDGNSICDIKDNSSTSWLEVNRNISGTVRPKKNLALQTELTNSEPVEVNNNPGSETDDIPVVTEIEIDLMLKTTKSKTKCRTTTKIPKNLIKSEAIEMNINHRSDSTYTSLATRVPPHSILITKTKDGSPENPIRSEGMGINIYNGSESTNTSLAAQVPPDSILETKTRCRSPEDIMKSEAMEINVDPGCQTEDIPSLAYSATQTYTKPILTKMKPKTQRIYKAKDKVLKKLIDSQAMQKNTCHPVTDSEDTLSGNSMLGKQPIPVKTEFEIKHTNKLNNSVLKKIKKSDNIQMNSNPATEIKSGILRKSDVQAANSGSEKQESKDDATYKSKGEPGKIRRKTDSTVQTTKTNDYHIDKTKDLSFSINKYRLCEEIYQPKVLLQNIAYSNKLSPAQKKILFRNNNSRKSPISTAYVIKVSPELEERYDKDFEAVSRIETATYEHSDPEKSKGRRKRRLERRRRIIRRSKVSARKTRPTICAPNLMRNEESSTQRECQLIGLSLQQRRSNQHNNLDRNLAELIIPQNKSILLRSLSGTMTLGIPLDLSIRKSDVSTSINSEFSEVAETLGEDICPGTNRHTNEHNIGFDSSTVKITDLNTSFIEICNTAKIIQPVLGSNSELSKNSNICGTPKLLEYGEFQNEKITSYTALHPAKEKFSTPSTASKYITEEASSITEGLPDKDQKFSIKVSIPAKHYFNKRLAIRKKLDKVVEREIEAPGEAQTVDHTKFDKTNHQVNTNITNSLFDQESDEINLIIQSQEPVGESSNECSRLTTPVHDTYKLDDVDANLSEPPKKFNTDATTTIPSCPRPTIKQSVSNKKNLPKIITDEFFPKDTITFSSVNCESTMFAAEISGEPNSDDVNKSERNKDNRELTVHAQNAFNSIVNVSKSPTSEQYRNEACVSADMDIIDLGTDMCDNLGEFKNLKPQLSPSSHSIQQDGISSTKLAEDMQTEGLDQSTVVNEQNFDSTQLWKICPELATYFGAEDVITNNNKDKVTKYDSLNTIETNDNNNSCGETFSTLMETNINVDNNTNLKSNDGTMYDAENANYLPNVIKGVVARNSYHNEMALESSEFAAIKSNTRKTSVILADLTTANLRNFTRISNQNDKNGLNWSVKSCQYYLSHGCNAEHSDNSVLDVGASKTSYKKMKSAISGSEKDFSQAESKYRKRKWTQERKKTGIKSIETKKLKLDRNRWSNGQDFENTCNYPIEITNKSISSGKAISSNLVKSKSSPMKTRHEELNILTIKTSQELNIAEEECFQSEHNNKFEDLDRKMVNCTEENEEEKISTATIIAEDTIINIDSDNLEGDIGNDKLLENVVSITSLQDTQNHGCNSTVDRNGNLTSLSSSSSSSSQSTESMSTSSPNGFAHSMHSDRNNAVKVAEPNGKKCQKKKDGDEELDEDCISLFAESLFTNFDQATTFMDVISMSPISNGKKESNEKYQDMYDPVAYFERNVEECNEAYESCIQENEYMMCNTLNIANNAFTNENNLSNINTNSYNRISPLLQMNVEQPNSIQSIECSAHEATYSPGTIFQKLNLNNTPNLRNRIGAEQGGPNIAFPHVEDLFRGHCFAKLRRGFCSREDCRFYHQLARGLQNLEQRDPSLIDEIISFAIYNNYYYFTRHIYSQVIIHMDYANIVNLFSKLLGASLINEYLVKCTITALIKIGITLRDFVRDIARLPNKTDNTLVEYILRATDTTELGAYWDTFRDILIEMKPSNLVINTVICECIYTNKDKVHIEDVYFNFVKKLTAEQLLNLNVNLRKEFDLLLVKNNLINQDEFSSQLPALFTNLNPNKTLGTKITENYEENQSKIPIILSPDDMNHSSENLSHLSTGGKEVSYKSNSQGFYVNQSLMKNQDAQSTSSLVSNQNVFSQGKEAPMQVDTVLNHQHSSDLNIKTLEADTDNTCSSFFKLHEIDDLKPPQSVYKERHWKFHLALQGLEQALKHEEYDYALNILNEYSDMEKTIFTSTCYKVLCKNVMASAQHVKNIIKLSVRMGVNKLLNETLFILGIYTMIEMFEPTSSGICRN